MGKRGIGQCMDGKKEELLLNAKLLHPRGTSSAYDPAPIGTIGITSHYTAVGETLAV
jgi:hypothetical protein